MCALFSLQLQQLLTHTMICMNLSLHCWLFLRLSYMYVSVCRYVHLSVGAWGLLLELSYKQAESCRLGTEFQQSLYKNSMLEPTSCSKFKVYSFQKGIQEPQYLPISQTPIINSHINEIDNLSNGLFWDRISWCHPDWCRIHYVGQADPQFTEITYPSLKCWD